jgi:hypothetical protein
MKSLRDDKSRLLYIKSLDAESVDMITGANESPSSPKKPSLLNFMRLVVCFISHWVDIDAFGARFVEIHGVDVVFTNARSSMLKPGICYACCKGGGYEREDLGLKRGSDTVGEMKQSEKKRKVTK